VLTLNKLNMVTSKLLFNKYAMSIVILLVFSLSKANADYSSISCNGLQSYLFSDLCNGFADEDISISGETTDYTYEFISCDGACRQVNVTWGANSGGHYTIKYTETILMIVVHTEICNVDIIAPDRTLVSNISGQSKTIWATSTIHLDPNFTFLASSSYVFNALITDCDGVPIGYSKKSALKQEKELLDSSEFNNYNKVIQSNIDEIKIFPNPTDGVVRFCLPKTISNCQVELYNINGKILKQFIVSTLNCEVNLSDYQNGIYFVKLISNNKFATMKIILNKK
jgi:hypothetical protein